MIVVFRSVSGFLWRFVWFRWLVIVLATRVPDSRFSGWLMFHTPLAISLHSQCCSRGKWKEAADLQRAMQAYARD